MNSSALKKENKIIELVNVDNTEKTRYQKIPVGELFYGNYQRGLKLSWVKKIAKNFKEGLLGVLIVNERDGKYYVIDGQHRLEALKVVGLKSIFCQVHTGLTFQEEAELFIEYNKRRKGLQVTDMFKAALEANDYKAHDIKRIVENNGFKLDFYCTKQNNIIIAISTLLHIYKNLKAEGLDRVLKLIRKTWGGERSSLERNFLMGIYYFVKLFNDDFTNEEFTSKMQKITPAQILREGRQDAKYSTAGKSIIPYAKIIWYYFNHKKSEKNRLSNKFLENIKEEVEEKI
jgi:hypothetical protein